MKQLIGKEDPSRIYIGKVSGYDVYFDGISYNCPELKLYGYSNDIKLTAAIKRKLLLEAKRKIGAL